MSEFIAGWVGGCCGLLLGHPFDTLKVRQQTLGFKSISRTAQDCIKTGGAMSLFRGLSYPLMAAGTLNSIFFGVYGTSLNLINNGGQNAPSYSQICLAGALGGAGQLVLAVPVELIKVKMQVHQGLKSPIDCVREIHSTEGIKGFYRGLGVQSLRDIKASAVYFLVYQYSLDKMKERRLEKNSKTASSHMNSENSTSSEMFIAGGLAGVLSWQAIIYLDVIKSLVQSDDPRTPRYRNAWHCAKVSYAREGLRIFGRGFTLMSIRAFPLNGATFVGYEHCLRFCNSS